MIRKGTQVTISESLKNSTTLQGISWMILTTFLFVAMNGIVRYLGGALPAAESAFLRYFLGTLIILPMVIKNWPGYVSRKDTGLFLLRGLFHGIGVALWFYAMAHIPMAEVTAIGYVSPIFITIGAALFLGERLQLPRILGVLCGILGTLIILRPGFQDINLGQIAQLCAAPLFAASFVIAKKLTETQSSTIIVGMLSVGCTITLIPATIIQWQTPTLEQFLWLALAAVVATLGHYTMTRALQAAPITLTQPLNFLQLIWATILGILLFGDPLDPFVLIGGAVIIGSATYISHRELRRSRLERERRIADI